MLSYLPIEIQVVVDLVSTNLNSTDYEQFMNNVNFFLILYFKNKINMNIIVNTLKVLYIITLIR